MARFDVYRFASTTTSLVLDVQANLLDDLVSCVVIPLSPLAEAVEEELPRLKPKLIIQGSPYILMTTDIAALPRSRLGDRITNIEADYRDIISNALNFLFVGF